MALITMTREIATLGKDVAAGLAERLGLEVVHHELIEHGIAERAGMRESEVHLFLEGEASLMERWRIDRKKLSRYTVARDSRACCEGQRADPRLGSNLFAAVDPPCCFCSYLCANAVPRA